MVAYHKNASNLCCFHCLASEFTAAGENNYARGIAMQIEEPLHFQSNGYRDRIAFYDATMKDKSNNPEEQCIH